MLDPLTPKSAGEIRAELQRGILALTGLLDGVDNPAQTLKFVNNLVQAATNVESLSDEDALDAQFLRELVAFGFQYAKLNPSTLPNPGAETDAFLATLWQAASGDTPSMRKAIGNISNLFESLDSPEKRIKLLQFETNLLKAVKSTTTLQEQIHDPNLLSAVVKLGGAYANLKSQTTPDSSGELLFSFLDLAWNSHDGTQSEETSEELQKLVQGFANPTEVLEFSHTMLQIAAVPPESRPKQLPRLPQVNPTLTTRTPPGNPFYLLFGIFPGDTPRFIQHYYEGGGAPVDLADWGLLETYQNAPDVQRGASKLRNNAVDEINRQASTGAPTQVMGELRENVNAESVIFSMGNSWLKLEYIATIDRSNPHAGRYAPHPSYVSYPYTLELRYSVNDNFVDALDEIDLIDGNQEFPGNPTPYPLIASWTIVDTGWTSPSYN